MNLKCNVKTCESYAETATGLCIECAKGVIHAMSRLGVPTDRYKANVQKLSRAVHMAKTTTTRIKRLQTALKKWQRRAKYYQKRTMGR